MIEGSQTSTRAGLLGTLIGHGVDLRQRLDRLNAQAATGQVSEDFAGLGGGAAVSLDLRPNLASLERWQTNIDAATTRMTVARTALGGIEAIAADLVSRLNSLNGINLQAVDAIAADARSALAQVADLLNSQVAGAYVFAGEDSGNPPVPNAEAIASSGFYTQIATAVAALGTNGATATANATLAIASSNASGTSPFSAYLSQPASALAAPAVEVGPGQRVRTGILASANGAVQSLGGVTTGSHMRDLMRALATIGSLSSTQANTAGFNALVQNTRTSLTGAVDAMSADAGVFGDTEASLATTRTQLGQTAIALTGQISRVEDVDMARTLSHLSRVEAQLQLSFQLIAGAKNLSLMNYLD